MSTKFFTNTKKNTLSNKFEGIFKYTVVYAFDALVGYFRSSASIHSTTKFKDLFICIILGNALVQILAERPLTFPDPINGIAKSNYDSIIKKAAASGHGDKVAVIGIQFIYPKEHPGEIHYQLFTIHSKNIGYSLFGQFVFINQDLIN